MSNGYTDKSGMYRQDAEAMLDQLNKEPPAKKTITRTQLAVTAVTFAIMGISLIAALRGLP